MNTSEHWQKRRARHKTQKNALRNSLAAHRSAIALPARVSLIRIAPRALDEDNAVSAFKHLRDCIADWLIPGLAPGRADGDPRIRWHYGQNRGATKEFAIEVIISSDERSESQ